MWDFRWIKCHWDRMFSEYFVSPLSVSFYQWFIFVFILILPLSEKQAEKAWEPLYKAISFRNREALDSRGLTYFENGGGGGL